MPPSYLVFGYVPDSQATSNFPFKAALRLLAMKGNLLISTYNNAISPQNAEDSLG